MVVGINHKMEKNIFLYFSLTPTQDLGWISSSIYCYWRYYFYYVSLCAKLLVQHNILYTFSPFRLSTICPNHIKWILAELWCTSCTLRQFSQSFRIELETLQVNIRWPTLFSQWLHKIHILLLSGMPILAKLSLMGSLLSITL